MPWKMKKIGEGENAIDVIEIDEKTGNPVFIHDDETETSVEAERLFGKIKAQLDSERKLKEANKIINKQLEDAKIGLERFADIDPEKYQEMSERLKNAEGKTLIDIGEVEKFRAQEKEAVTKEWQKKFDKEKTKYDELIKNKEAEIVKIQSMLHDATISNFFSHSKYIVGPNRKVMLTPSKMESIYGKHFNTKRDENGNLSIVGFWENGEEIRSSSKTGEIAEPDDALWQLIMNDPDKDIVLLGDNQSGGGTDDHADARGNISGQKPTTLKGLTEREKIEAIKKYGQDYINEIILKDLRSDRDTLKETMKGYNTQ